MARKFVRDTKGQFASKPGGAGKAKGGSSLGEKIGQKLSSPKRRELRTVERSRIEARNRAFHDPRNNGPDSGDRYFVAEKAIDKKHDKKRAEIKAKYAKAKGKSK